VLVWSRAVFKYLPTIRWLHAPALAVQRVLLPLLAVAVVGFWAVMGSAHVAVLLYGASERRFASFQAALGTIVEELANFNALAASDETPAYLDARFSRGRGQWVVGSESMGGVTRGRAWGGVGAGRRVQGAGMEGWGRGGWAMRNGRTEGDGFLDCVRLVALLVGSWAVGVAIRAMQVPCLAPGTSTCAHVSAECSRLRARVHTRMCIFCCLCGEGDAPSSARKCMVWERGEGGLGG
jgi:hypothetical protein